MSDTSSASTVLSVRVSADERALLEAASEQVHASLSDFVRRSALAAAEVEVLERSVVTISAKDWKALEVWLARPPKANAAWKKLARKTPTWQR